MENFNGKFKNSFVINMLEEINLFMKWNLGRGAYKWCLSKNKDGGLYFSSVPEFSFKKYFWVTKLKMGGGVKNQKFLISLMNNPHLDY